VMTMMLLDESVSGAEGDGDQVHARQHSRAGEDQAGAWIVAGPCDAD
jgi:hypothetical protein